MKLRTGLVPAVILVLGATGYFLVRSAEDRVTADMLSRTERFAIPSGWELEVETVRSERFLCMDTNPCPSLYRRWNAGKQLTAADVAAVVSKVGFEMKSSQICGGSQTPSAPQPPATPKEQTAITTTSLTSLART